jgi:dTDP-4-dehydrorhamnose 3,5-epimerase
MQATTGSILPEGTVAEYLNVKSLSFPELFVFSGDARQDERGVVTPSFNAFQLKELGIQFDFCHENHCYSPKRGTVRGFHYQLPPHGQAKLIRVTRGRILDVNVDMRRSSPTFGQHVAQELSPENWNQIYVPEGFAHCYCTLEDDCEVIFKLGHPFAPDYARGFAWNDPALKIDWLIDPSEAIVLERDLQRPAFEDIEDLFP